MIGSGSRRFRVGSGTARDIGSPPYRGNRNRCCRGDRSAVGTDRGRPELPTRPRLRAEQVHEERCEASRLARLARATPVHEPLREELRPYFEATRHRNDFAAR